jgi:hypothetical protein
MIRALALAAALALAGCASTPTTAPPASGAAAYSAQGQWSFAFDAGPGVATATYAAPGKPAEIVLSCAAPRGPFTVQDFTLTAAPRGASGQFAIGGSSSNHVAQPLPAADGRTPYTFTLGVRDTVFNALTPNAAVTIAVSGGAPRALPAGAASRINDVLNSCRVSGS